METWNKSDNFRQLTSEALADPLRTVDYSKPVWIFGAGNFGQGLCRAFQAKGVSVGGFVVSEPIANKVADLPVYDWDTSARLQPDAQLAFGILNAYTPFDKLLASSQAAGYSDMLMPWDTYDFLHDLMGWRFWLSRRDYLLSHIDRIQEVADRLADQESRDVLYRMIAFRLGLDISYSSYLSPERHYFNEFTLEALSGREITYVDCGAYTGDTYSELLNQPAVQCGRAYLLEPDPANYAKLVTNTQAASTEAICLPLAATEDYSILSFNSGQGDGSSINSGGDTHIAAVALDQLLPNTYVDLIKLDVEGSEARVLRGATKIIRRSRPVLAISLYHNPQDPWELPEILFDLCENYDFLIRQHLYNTFESVLYAIPR